MSASSAPSAPLEDLLRSIVFDEAGTLLSARGGAHSVRGAGGLVASLPTGESIRSARALPVVTTVDDYGSSLADDISVDIKFSQPQKRKAVTSDDSVSVLSHKYGGNVNKSFSVTRLPLDLDMYTSMCLSTVGKGNAFCLRRNCSTNHRATAGTSHKAPRPGDIIVAKIPGQQGFYEPKLPSSMIDSSLITEWMSESHPLSVWATRVDQVVEAAASGPNGKVVTAASLEEVKEEEEKAVRFRTPKKHRRLESKLPDEIGYSPYSCNLEDGHEAFASTSTEERIQKLIDLVIELDRGLSGTSGFITKLNQEVSNIFNEAMGALKAVDTKIRLVKREVGERPTELPDDIDGSTIWIALKTIAEKTGSESQGQRALDHLGLGVATRVGSLESASGRLEKSLVQSLELFKRLMTRVSVLETAAVPGRHPTDSNNGDITARMENLEDEVAKVKASSLESTISFAGLGFDGPDKANAWLETNLPGGQIGYIVDPHTVFEHLSKEIFPNVDFLKEFERADRLKIPDPQFSTAMTSFTNPMPRIFSKGNVSVVRADTSYFDLIPTWEAWDHQETGHCAVIKMALADFEVSHQNNINQAIESGSRAYNVAVLSLTQSVAFVNALIRFIDDYMKHLTVAKFSTKRAFHVTTRLAKRILVEVFKPRRGVVSTFKTGGAVDQIAQKIFWASIQCLDVALDIHRIGMEHHHLVASELVRFLAVNTGFEAIEALSAKVEKFTSSIKEATDSNKAAQKTAATASNQVNDLTTKVTNQAQTIEALKRRLTALEAKVK